MLEVEQKLDLRNPGFFILREPRHSNPDSPSYRASGRSHLWRPSTDVFETGEEVVVRVEIAGMEEANFSIVLDGRSLSIRGVRPDQSERRAYQQMEIRFGEFGTDVELPVDVVIDEIEAVYRNGFLLIRFPKAQPKQIKIE